MTEKEIGFVLGVKPTTINQWKQRYPEFKKACAEGKSIAKAYLVAKGLRAAMGYDVEERDTTLVRNEEGELVVQKEVRKLRHRPADKDLLIFFLLNMDRMEGKEEWKHVKSIEITEKKQNLNVNLSGNIASEDIRKLAGAALKEADKQDKKRKSVESKTVKTD
ncbi:MAG: hypothetical protein JRI56_00190 [Deltaproteobacteria bacterium]|nr:hypothetical protein [Deltaproteobacteria bacterium]